MLVTGRLVGNLAMVTAALTEAVMWVAVLSAAVETGLVEMVDHLEGAMVGEEIGVAEKALEGQAVALVTAVQELAAVQAVVETTVPLMAQVLLVEADSGAGELVDVAVGVAKEVAIEVAMDMAIQGTVEVASVVWKVASMVVASAVQVVANVVVEVAPKVRGEEVVMVAVACSSCSQHNLQTCT